MVESANCRPFGPTLRRDLTKKLQQFGLDRMRGHGPRVGHGQERLVAQHDNVHLASRRLQEGAAKPEQEVAHAMPPARVL